MRRIRFRRKRTRACWGISYWHEWLIYLDPELEPKTEMEIACHEALHLLFPYSPEQEIDNAGKTLADLLWRLGYRHQDEVE